MKKKIYISLIIFGLIIFALINLINFNYSSNEKSKLYLRIVYILPENFKKFIKQNVFVFERIKNLENQNSANKKKINSLVTNFEDLLRDGKIEKIYLKKISNEKFVLNNKDFSLKKF